MIGTVRCELQTQNLPCSSRALYHSATSTDEWNREGCCVVTEKGKDTAFDNHGKSFPLQIKTCCEASSVLSQQCLNDVYCWWIGARRNVFATSCEFQVYVRNNGLLHFFYMTSALTEWARVKSRNGKASPFLSILTRKILTGLSE